MTGIAGQQVQTHPVRGREVITCVARRDRKVGEPRLVAVQLVLALIQTHIVAGETDGHPETLFGTYYFKQYSLEVAVAPLAALLNEVDDLNWSPA